MQLIVLGSSSKGNGYALKSSTGEVLLLEAGLPFLDVLRAIEYDRSRIVGCLCSHRHQDHAKFVSEFIENGIRVYSNKDVENADTLEERRWHNVGMFSVMPFNVTHDVPNYGYIIKHHDMGSLFFATDCMDIPITFVGIDHFLIEANYSDSILLLSDTDNAQKRRIIQSHQSFEYCKQYLEQAHAEHSKNIILIHLSSRHSNSDLFQKDIEKTFGVPCYIAKKNLIVQL